MIVDLCAGPGGWDTGARLAGYTGPIVGIELDHAACRTGMAAGHHRIRADIATYPAHVFRGRVDGLIGSPPCTGMSPAGEGVGRLDIPNVCRLVDDHAAGRPAGCYTWHDERSPLSAEPMRWAVAIRPPWIALEQVPPVLPIWRHTDLPEGAQVLSVGPPRDGGDHLDLWAVVDPRNDTLMGRMPRDFHIVGTGHPLPADASAYIGTTSSHDGALIWHVFEVIPR